ncbi:MAG: DUF4349 domain-containing protein [Clostridiales bacterium]|jgi:hypothetical protein|nr:DUF4349 domain-containing protein [Clostridiales bacterium]
MKKRLITILVLMLVALMLVAGCSANSAVGYVEPPKEYVDEEPTYIVGVGNRLLIFQYDCNIESADNAEIAKKLTQKFDKYDGGYIEYSNLYSAYNGKTWEYRVRIKAEFFEEFIAYAAEQGTLTNESRTTVDATDSYLNLEAAKAAKEAALVRLLELYETANLNEMSYLNMEMERVQAELNRINADLSGFDSALELYRVTIKLFQPTTASDSIASNYGGVGASFLNFIVGFLVVLLYLLPFALVGLGILLIIRLSIRRHRKRAAAAAASRPAPVYPPMNAPYPQNNPYYQQPPVYPNNYQQPPTNRNNQQK